MQLPRTTIPAIFWVSSVEGYVNIASGNVVSLVDRLQGQPAVQTTKTAQPTWSYNGANNQGAVVFSGSQYLSSAACGKTLSQHDFTVGWVSSCSAIAGSNTYAVSLSNSATSTSVGVEFGGGNVTLSAQNDAGGNGTNAATDDGKIHAYLLTKTGSTITVRRDGTQICTLTNTGVFTFNTLTLGALNVVGGVSGQFKGKIQTVVGYYGALIPGTGLGATETYLKVLAGTGTSEGV